MAAVHGGPPQIVFYGLTGDSERRWGEIAGAFSGRVEHAAVSLRKANVGD
jgi:hypothetical protein